MSSSVFYIASALSSLCCCFGFMLLFFGIIGFMMLRKRGKKSVSVTEAIQEGAEMSRAFVRGGKSREQLLAEEEEEERNNRR